MTIVLKNGAKHEFYDELALKIYLKQLNWADFLQYAHEYAQYVEGVSLLLSRIQDDEH